HARLGKEGERFVALNGETYAVDDQITVIADDNGVLGIGGVMGGESTGSSMDTVNVFYESAYFDTVRTAISGRRTEINSDARYRFERGIDPQSEIEGANLAAHYVKDICGGEVSAIAMAGAEPEADLTIAFDPALVAKLTGLDVKASACTRILKALGFTVGGKGKALKVSVPSWRPDVHGPADLVEEVIRIVGIDTVPSVAMTRDFGVARPVMTPRQLRVRRARRTLAARGMVEAVTWSFITKPLATHFGGGSDVLELANPISSELSTMRPSLLPGLLEAARKNRDRGIAEVALFEVGQVYAGDSADEQFTSVAGVRTGTAELVGAGRDWNGAADTVDAFDVKADAAAVLSALGLDARKVQISRSAPDWFHPGRSGTFQLGPKNQICHFGELHPLTCEALDLAPGAVAFELTLERLPQPKAKTPSKPAVDLAELQPVRRDFAFVVDADVAAGDIIRAASGADKKLITDVLVFDVFEGDRVGAGKKSVAIEVVLQPRGKSMTDDEIDAISQKIAAQVKKSTGGELRS
ncbi:MAG: phenylalanine--tRNA ligase subunit beta, partial [Pseudomonadota bacterium]